MDEIDYVVPEYGPRPVGPLNSYLHSLAPNFINSYVESCTTEGDIVLDPFCQTDSVAREALKLKRKAILSAFNPINAFVARTLYSELTTQQLSYALVRLSEGDKLQTSLRAHLGQLYTTTCPRCSQRATVSYFLWNRSDNRPLKKYYVCQTCKAGNGVKQMVSEAVTEDDLRVLEQVEPRGFHYWYVLDRLAPSPGVHPLLAKQALELYTPRNLYALVTLLMQIESAFENSQYQDILKLALLECLDSCSKLGANVKQSRPWLSGKSWRPPTRFIERNVWEAFEDNYRRICDQIEQRRLEGYHARLAKNAEQLINPGPLPRAYAAPNLAVTRQSARLLTDCIPENSVHLVITKPPDHASTGYIGLSLLWAGWLFGREQAAVFDGLHFSKGAVDWTAYFRAMVLRLRAVLHVLKPECLVVFRFASDERMLCNVLVVAGAAAGLSLKRILYQPFEVDSRQGKSQAKQVTDPISTSITACADGSHENDVVVAGVDAGLSDQSVRGDYCIQFAKPQKDGQRPGSPTQAKPSVLRAGLHTDAQSLETALKGAASSAIRDVLTQRGEPMDLTWLSVAVYERLGKDGLLLQVAESLGQKKGEAFDSLYRAVEEAIYNATEKDFLRIGSDGDAKGPALWWLSRKPFTVTPVHEQVEQAVYNVLNTNATIAEQSISRVIGKLFPGYLTPQPGWIQTCLASYAVENPPIAPIAPAPPIAPASPIAPAPPIAPVSPSGWRLRPEDQLQKRTLEHAQMVAALVELGHSLGYRIWISRDQQKQPFGRGVVRDLLTPDELSSVPSSVLGNSKAGWIDVVWHDHGLLSHVFEVEWMAVFAEDLLVRGAVSGQVRKYLVVPEERVGLIGAKMTKFPWVRQAMARGSWEFIKFQHLLAFVAKTEDRNLYSFGKYVGLHPVIEQEAAQLRLF